MSVHEVLEVVGRIRVSALASRVDGLGSRTREVSTECLGALEEFARAVAVLGTEGLVSGAAAQECARILSARVDAAAEAGHRNATAMTKALDSLYSADEEVARDVAGR